MRTYLQELVSVAFEEVSRHHLVSGNGSVQILLQVHRQELEDQIQSAEQNKNMKIVVETQTFGSSPVLLHDDVLKTDNVGVLELFQQRDLSDGCGGHPFLFGLQPNLFHGHNLICLPVPA